MTECNVCLGKHDREIHEATRRVRVWFRDFVTAGMKPVLKAPSKVGNPFNGSSGIGLIPKGAPLPDWPNRA